MADVFRTRNFLELRDYLVAHPALVLSFTKYDYLNWQWVAFFDFPTGAGGVAPYAPGTPTDWVVPLPTTVGEAIDRIAAVVGPVP